MTSAPSSPFAAVLRAYRLVAGLSQETLAERAGLSARAVSDLERGARRFPYPHTVSQLAKALRLTAADRARLEAASRRPPDDADGGAPEPRPLTNLPAQLTSFVGREGEMAEVRRLLTVTRLLTLIGTGGCGKTRLALQVAADVVDEYPDGVWLAELGPLATPDLVPQAVVAALGLREVAGQPVIATLLDQLKTRRLLLVLDNCEHLLDACASVTDAVLRGAPGVRVLATSREPLGIAGEVRWRVPSLPAPTLDRPVAGGDDLASTIGRYAGVRLFVDRAVAVQPDFAVTAQNAPAVAQVCARLDGLPLALELAAARVAALTVEQVASRLDDAFRLLTGGSRTAAPRQQTLRATLDWSHALLTEPERTVFRRLAAFAGGWTLEAAEYVCGEAGMGGSGDDSLTLTLSQRERELASPPPRLPTSPLDVLDLLTRLVEKSLVVAEERSGEARYRLLEPVRQYAAEKLDEAGEETAVCARHRDWCLALAERAEPELHGPAQLAWLDRLATEHDNLRAALAWSLERDDPAAPEDDASVAEAGLRLAGALWPFWRVRQHRGEARAWLERALARRGDGPPAARAKALCAAGVLHAGAVGLAQLEESATLYRALGDEGGLAFALICLGGKLRISGLHYDEGTARLAEGLRLARATGDRWLMAEALGRDTHSADVLRAGEPARVRAAAEESLALFRAVGDRPGAAQAQEYVGWAARGQGDYAAARAAFAAALTGARTFADWGLAACALTGLGTVAREEGDLAGATTLYRESLAQRHGPEPSWEQGDSLDGLAAVAVARGQPVRAARLLGAADAVRTALAMQLLPIERPGHDEPARAARAALGAAAFAAALAEGQALSPEEAVAYALAYEPDPEPAADEQAEPGRLGAY